MPGKYLGIFTGSKAAKREADHPPACSTEVKKEWSQTSNSFTPSWCSQVRLCFYLAVFVLVFQRELTFAASRPQQVSIQNS